MTSQIRKFINFLGCIFDTVSAHVYLTLLVHIQSFALQLIQLAALQMIIDLVMEHRWIKSHYPLPIPQNNSK